LRIGFRKQDATETLVQSALQTSNLFTIGTLFLNFGMTFGFMVSGASYMKEQPVLLADAAAVFI